MNPFNVLWIALTWLLVAACVGGLYQADHVIEIGMIGLVSLGLMVTGQTIGVDRAEREWNWERTRLTKKL